MKYCLLGGAGVFAIHTAKYLLEQKVRQTWLQLL